MHSPAVMSRAAAELGIACLRLAVAPVASVSPARPGVQAIVEALRTHPVVAIGELHGSRIAGDFYIQLVRDPSFQRAVNAIVVEFASGQSQALLDRYVLRGDSLPPDTLRSIWRNTTKAASWESPVYAEWLASVRAVNLTLPRPRRIRVLAGDTPIDWTHVRRHADWERLGDNNRTFAKVIGDEVIAKGGHALVVLGNNHLSRGGTFRERSTNAAALLETRFPGSLLYVAMIYYGGFGDTAADARITREGWTAPAVVPMSAWIGDRPIATAKGPVPFRAFADAVLYLGPRSTLRYESPPAADIEPAYRRELVRRALIEWGDSTRLARVLPL